MCNIYPLRLELYFSGIYSGKQICQKESIRDIWEKAGDAAKHLKSKT